MLELQQPCSNSTTAEQEQQEPIEAMETQQSCYSPTPIVRNLAAQSNELLSLMHKAGVLYPINLRKDGEKIDAALTKQLEDEKKYWSFLLEMIINDIKFLCERGLAFRGTDERVGSLNNGNYLGLLELITTVDAFLCQHIKMYANHGKGHTSYLSKTICEEVVKILGKAAEGVIVNEVSVQVVGC